MDWNTKDIDVALQSKEYIDTAVIPLVPVMWGDTTKSVVKSGEFVQLLSKQMEHKYKGRIILFPPFTYLSSEPLEDKASRLKQWEEVILGEGMKHILYVTCDHRNKEMETTVTSSIVWVPALPLEMMDDKMKQEMINAQVDEVMTILLQQWD